MGIEPLDEKWRAFDWEVHEVDGHDVAALTELLRRVKADTARERPACIIARTIKGKGVSYMETEPGWHLGYLAPEDAERAVAEIEAEGDCAMSGPLSPNSWQYRSSTRATRACRTSRTR